MDVLHLHRQVPTCAHDRICDFRPIVEARKRCPQRIALPVLFVKAFALIAEKHAVLRQSLIRWPWPHLYEHPYSVAMVATHRDFRGEPWLFWSRLTRPEAKPLLQLQADLDHYLTAPCNKVFLRQVQMSALPTPIRRLLWWWTLN